MLSSLALSLARSTACCTSAPMLGAVGAVAHHLRPWLDGYRFRRNFAAQAMQVAADSDSDVEQLPVYSHPASHLVEKPAPVPAVKGRIHSVDTFSAVDGPGLRMVVFEQVGAATLSLQCLALRPRHLYASDRILSQVFLTMLCPCRAVPCGVPSAATPTHGHPVGVSLSHPRTLQHRCAGAARSWPPSSLW